jgi:hypothetical protein
VGERIWILNSFNTGKKETNMAYEKVKRNRFYDPPVLPSTPEFIHPHSSKNHYEDSQEFHRPLGRMHNANLHDWGIARGLEITGTLGSTTLQIQPGVAIDGQGELISLSPIGHGDIGPNPPGGQNTEKTVPVDLSELLGSQSAYKNKTVYITIQFSEIMRGAEGSGGRMEQVPWIRLQPTSGAGAYIHDGQSVILAVADIDGAGDLDLLEAKHGSATYSRQVIGQTIETLTVERSTKAGNSVKEVTSGTIGPGANGGLQITVPKAGDDVLISRENGGGFDKLEVKGSVRGNQSGALRVDTGNGYVDVGPKNTSWSHFYTDREKYYFNKEIRVDSGQIGSYNENLQLRTAGITRVTIRRDTGRVGIGTTTPNEQLVVTNQAVFGGDITSPGSEPITVTGGGAGVSFQDRGGVTDRFVIYNNAGALRFWEGSDRVVIAQNTGNVGIGATNPTEKLHVGGRIRVTNVPVWDGTDDNDLTWNGAIITREGSSHRYKKNVSPMKEDFSKILEIEGKQYQMAEGYGPPDAWLFGYMAEDLEAIGLTNLVIYDEEGHPDGIKYKKISIYLNEVVKNHQKVIEELQAVVKNHQKMIEELQAEVASLK